MHISKFTHATLWSGCKSICAAVDPYRQTDSQHAYIGQGSLGPLAVECLLAVGDLTLIHSTDWKGWVQSVLNGDRQIHPGLCQAEISEPMHWKPHL